MPLTPARRTAFVLAGIIGLLLRDRYQGPAAVLVHSYGGNFTVSFAVYFLLRQFPPRTALALAFAAVNLFEATDGFHFMSNTYDPFDYLANSLGLAVAMLVDRCLHSTAHP